MIMASINYKKIPVITTTQLRKAFEKNGYKTDESNHKHIKFINEQGHEFILRKGNKDYTKFVIKEIIQRFAKAKGLREEEALKLLFGKK